MNSYEFRWTAMNYIKKSWPTIKSWTAMNYWWTAMNNIYIYERLWTTIKTVMNWHNYISEIVIGDGSMFISIKLCAIKWASSRQRLCWNLWLLLLLLRCEWCNAMSYDAMQCDVMRYDKIEWYEWHNGSLWPSWMTIINSHTNSIAKEAESQEYLTLNLKAIIPCSKYSLSLSQIKTTIPWLNQIYKI